MLVNLVTLRLSLGLAIINDNMQLLKRKRLSSKLSGGFTIVELLTVIIVIAILATIVTVSYGTVRQKAADSKRDSDLKSLEDAIETARYNQGKTLSEITSNSGVYSWFDCAFGYSGSPEPRDLATSTPCWQYYYTALDDIATAADVNLDDLKKGDARGDPYIILEKEGSGFWGTCVKSTLGYFTGSGSTNNSSAVQIPLSSPECL